MANLDPKVVMYVVGGLLLFLGIAALARKESKVIGMNKMFVGIIVAAIGAYLVFGLGMGALENLGIKQLAAGVDSGSAPPLGDNLGGNGDKGTFCAVEDTTVTLSATNAYTKASPGGSHRYRINGQPALTVADAGTFTASPEDLISVLWMNASNTSAYFADVSEERVPCRGTFIMSKQVYNNGSITIDVFNRDGNNIDNTLTNETVAAGDTATLEVKFTGQFERGFPYGGLCMVEYNTSEFDDVILNMGGQKEAVIDSYTVQTTQMQAKAYSFPALLSNAVNRGTLYYDADDATNPATSGDITLRCLAKNYFINEDKAGGVPDGPAAEDEDDARTFVGSNQTDIVGIT